MRPSQIRPLVALVMKDLQVFMTDRYGLLLSYVAPICLASFMAVIFGGFGSTPQNAIQVKLVDEDGSVNSAEILARARADSSLTVESLNREPATAAVREGKAALAVIIPAGFGDAADHALMGEGPSPELLVVHDPNHSSELNMVRGILSRIVVETVAADLVPERQSKLTLSLLEDELLKGIGTEFRIGQSVKRIPVFDQPDQPGVPGRGFPLADPVVQRAGLTEVSEPTNTQKTLSFPYAYKYESITGGGPTGERHALAAHAFASMVVQFVLFLAVEWGISLLNERNSGVWMRLRTAPVSRFTLLLSKTIGCAITSLSITAVVLTFGSLVFGYTLPGTGFMVLLMALAFSAMASTFGLLVAAVGRSAQGARAVSILAVLVMVLLGGGWIPSFLFPRWLQNITPVVPTRWAIDGFDAVISRGFTLQEITPTLIVLAGFSLAFGLLGSLASRWSAES